MTFGEIYNRVMFAIYGDTTEPESVEGIMKGSEGILSTIHRQIQETRDWWFMEKDYPLDVSADDGEYDIDFGNFKRERLLQIEQSDGTLRTPLKKIEPLQAEVCFLENMSAEYPIYYEIKYPLSLKLWPVPTEDCTLHINYYGYLDRPAEELAAFNAAEDILTLEAAYLIINLGTFEIATLLDYSDKANTAYARAINEQYILNRKDWHYRSKDFMTLPYRGV